jgi:hypothetical protein
LIEPLAIVLAAVLGVLSLLHLSWGFGFYWPGKDSVSLAEAVGGVPPGRRMHPTWMCVAVALAIAAGAAVILAFSAGSPGDPWRGLSFLAYVVLFGVFLGRGVAGFVPAIWRRTEGTPFHRLNRLYYSPLCLLIAAGMAVNFALG